MEPVKTEQSNAKFRGDGAGIRDIWAERGRIEGGSLDGGRVTFTVWEFTDEERDNIAKGHNLKLGILFLERIPPTSLQIVDEVAIPEGDS